MVDEAVKHGSQIITRRGVETAVVVGIEDYADLQRPKGKGTLLDFFQNSPLRGVELDLTRSKDTGRDIAL